jgi:hypothetical protein
MSQVATPVTHCRRTPPHVAKGATFGGLMVAMWSAFVTLLAVSPETLDDAYDWLTGLPIVWEVVMWILLLPWALAYLVWESSWAEWVRIIVIVLMVGVHLLVSAPRVQAQGTGADAGVDVSG